MMTHSSKYVIYQRPRSRESKQIKNEILKKYSSSFRELCIKAYGKLWDESDDGALMEWKHWQRFNGTSQNRVQSICNMTGFWNEATENIYFTLTKICQKNC